MKIVKVCGTCDWHDEFTCVCCNGRSKFRADVTELIGTCRFWTDKNKNVLGEIFASSCGNDGKPTLDKIGSDNVNTRILEQSVLRNIVPKEFVSQVHLKGSL